MGLSAEDIVHPGITCDGSKQRPLVGKRYHKIGHNYDLNETEFKKLSNDDQEKYEVIAFPGATPVPVATAPDCVFVRDVTVPDKQVIRCGKLFKKVWLVKTGAAGWPAGCTLNHVAGDKMSAPDRIELEPQNANELVGFRSTSLPLLAMAKPLHNGELLVLMASFSDILFGLPSLLIRLKSLKLLTHQRRVLQWLLLPRLMRLQRAARCSSCLRWASLILSKRCSVYWMMYMAM